MTRTERPPSDNSRPARSIDAFVDATPATRDRYIDFLRALSIVVVVLWHWVFSITHWTSDGRLTMPNPIGGIPLLWSATWLLQIIPVFFFVGGFSNYTGWIASRRERGTDTAFVRSRLSRILAPVTAFIGTWVVIEVIGRLVVADYRGVWHWGRVVFVPLWFIGVYAGVILLVPLTARLHRTAPVRTICVLGAAIAAVDLVRFQFGVGGIGVLNGAFVFLFSHQLGYFYADGTLTRWSRQRLWALTLASLVALTALTSIGLYPRSMVASTGGRFSNLNPPTVVIACLAVFQVGVAMLLRGATTRWLARRRPWRAVIAINGVIMTLFVWHMSAYVLALGLVQLAAGAPGAHATGTWWFERPVWLVLPALMLVPLVALFARVELRRIRSGCDGAGG